jgi:hypothetical protein
MWIFLWVVLSMFVMGVFLWSMIILQQQKRAWFAFAKRTGLNYQAGAYTDPPVVSGMVKGYKVTFFTDSLRTQDVRGRRFVTTIEVEMGDGMPTVAALATQDYAEFLSPLRLPLSWQPPGEDWKKNYIIKTRSTDRLVRYLTAERLKVLNGLFTTKNAATLFFFDEQACILRIETSDPLRDADKMERISKRIFSAVDVLLLTPEERRQIFEEWKAAQAGIEPVAPVGLPVAPVQGPATTAPPPPTPPPPIPATSEASETEKKAQADAKTAK